LFIQHIVSVNTLASFHGITTSGFTHMVFRVPFFPHQFHTVNPNTHQFQHINSPHFFHITHRSFHTHHIFSHHSTSHMHQAQPVQSTPHTSSFNSIPFNFITVHTSFSFSTHHCFAQAFFTHTQGFSPVINTHSSQTTQHHLSSTHPFTAVTHQTFPNMGTSFQLFS